jgi:stage V sporulation protein AD
MKSKIDLFIAGDLENQITASCYSAIHLNVPFLGVYSACASNVEGLIIASNLINAKQIKNSIVSVSSHNMVSERQFRNPTEYGAPKPLSATFTATGGASAFLSNNKGEIKVESGTIGKVCDMDQTDPNNMGACMAVAAANTIYQHLKDLKREVNYYDLIVTGDLGIYGKEILIEYMQKEYQIDLSRNYQDCGVMLYDRSSQKEVAAGGSGPVCSALVVYGDIVPKLRNKKLKKVLYVATGALFSPISVFQKENILSIAHAISLEVVE